MGEIGRARLATMVQELQAVSAFLEAHPSLPSITDYGPSRIPTLSCVPDLLAWALATSPSTSELYLFLGKSRSTVTLTERAEFLQVQVVIEDEVARRFVKAGLARGKEHEITLAQLADVYYGRPLVSHP